MAWSADEDPYERLAWTFQKRHSPWLVVIIHYDNSTKMRLSHIILPKASTLAIIGQQPIDGSQYATFHTSLVPSNHHLVVLDVL
jgi:hypothetical protein